MPGYREVVARLGPGLVLDIGCGVGDETARLDGRDRVVVGVDYSAPTARDAAAEWGPGGSRGKQVRFAAMDGARLGLRAGVVDWACSSHIIEHFTNPALHVAELARVLAPGGTAFVITPNAPADFENPFHVYLFEPAHLRSLLQLFFSDVQVLGLEGDDALHADFAARRERQPPAEARRAPAPSPPPPPRLRVGLRALASRRVPPPRPQEHRDRVRPRRVAPLPHRSRRPHHPGPVRHRPCPDASGQRRTGELE